MRGVLTAAVLACAVPVSLAGAGQQVSQETRWVRVVVERDLPVALTDPEGRSEWDLRSLTTERPGLRVIVDAGGDELSVEDRESGPARAPENVWRVRSADEGADARRWLLPRHDESLYDAEPASELRLSVEDGRGRAAALRIARARVGLGWLHLPSGPREVLLQRALIFRPTASGRGWEPDRLVHRWIDPRAGVVAEVEGPASPDGASRRGVTAASIVDGTRQPEVGMRIYDFMMDPPVFTRVTYGYDAGPIAVSALTPAGHATIGELIAAPAWDFSGLASGVPTAQTISPVNANETCSYQQCGFNRPDVKLGRQDKNFDDPANAVITTTVLERELRVDGTGQPTDVTLWLRAGVNKEGQSGSLGEGESRLCYVDDGRTPVPLWRFAHRDATGWYWNLGDSWSSDGNPSTPEPDTFNCDNTIFQHTCPNSCGLFCRYYIKSCTGYSGTQGSAAIGEGPVTLPSGHTFNALVVRNVAEFCVYLGSSCSSPVFRVRTVIYLWEVPWLGTVVRLTSAQNAPDFVSFAQVEETDVKFGLFPPRSVTAGTATDTSIEIYWDPGLDTSRIDGFKVYWSSVSGDYDDTRSLVQPATMGNSAVVTGLEPGTTYFFTVTSLSDFTNPATLQTTSYESLVYPLTLPATPQPVPIEVMAQTTGGTCAPTEEVSGLTVDRVAGDDIELCWNPVSDACADGYRILGAASPESAENFVPVIDDTGLSTCWTLAPAHGYYLVVAKGPGGSGPLGHFGQ